MRLILKCYSARGHLTRLKSGTTVLQDVQDTDAFGSASVTSFANGLKTLRGYDASTGRLSSIQTGTVLTPKNIQDLEYQWRSNATLYKRIDHRNTTSTGDDYTDTFSYDALERVTAQATSVGATRTLSFGYDLYGNLTSKTSNTAGDLNVTPYGYGVAGKPHRLASVTIAGMANTVSYDANGSITTYDAASGNDTFLSYDGQNNVTKITVGTSAGTTTPAARDEFWYDPDGARFLGRESWDASGTQKSATTVYLGTFEEVVPASGGAYNLVQRTDLTATVRHIRTRTTGGVYASRFEYVHRDHLGSVDAVTDSSGVLLNNKTSHDPFAGRREANWASDITAASLTTLLGNEDERFARGYTDHEQLNRTGFIHMNGRVYDPRIGRFVSADPVIQFPQQSQSYNRYSYVRNSPLSSTDPRGFKEPDGGVEIIIVNAVGPDGEIYGHGVLLDLQGQSLQSLLGQSVPIPGIGMGTITQDVINNATYGGDLYGTIAKLPKPAAKSKIPGFVQVAVRWSEVFQWATIVGAAVIFFVLGFRVLNMAAGMLENTATQLSPLAFVALLVMLLASIALIWFATKSTREFALVVVALVTAIATTVVHVQAYINVAVRH